MPGYLKNTALWLILATILTVNGLRFYDLENTPKGFFIDEIAVAVNANCLGTQGRDYSGKKWPLFGMIGFGSPKPPTQMYPLALWIKTFGISIASIRAFSACLYTLYLIGIFFLARLMAGPTCAWLVLLAASISPWGWLFSRITGECIFTPVFLVWGVFFFLLNTRWWSILLSAVFFASAIYSYPPTSLHAPFVVLGLAAWRAKEKKIGAGSLRIFLTLLGLLCIPLIYYTLHSGTFNRHFNDISILSTSSSPMDFIGKFAHNYLAHLAPNYLFFSGDANLRYSTKHFGVLSWLDLLGLAAGIFLLVRWMRSAKPPSLLVLFLLTAAATGLIPSALTFGDMPNAARSIGAQPFIELLVGYCLAQIIESYPQMLLAPLTTGIIFAVCFLSFYFKTYPAESAEAFGSSIRVEAENCRTDQDWVEFFKHYSNDRIIFQYFIMRNYHKPYANWFF